MEDKINFSAEIKVFSKAGYDNKCIGACYQSQRILMIAEIKFNAGVLPKYEVIPVNVSKPPKEFKELGLHLRVPALFLSLGKKEEFEPIDIADDIVLELESRYPGGLLKNELEAEAESATRNLFSKFCHWMRGVAKDSGHLETELAHLDSHLSAVSVNYPQADKLYLCGDRLALVDCEVLPKLHQVRVAAQEIKGYELPRNLTHVWRYLHSAYSDPAFVKCCPSDTEILLHWLDTGSVKLSARQQQLLAASSGKPPTFSFTVPATATRVELE
ncbi:Chloride intracellular channel protein 6 [Homalodisca vitripennis]|nr:Chloride intracellular channel protein 6 [Homalodisca vitripennis]